MYRYVMIIKDEVINLKGICEDMGGVGTGRRWGGSNVNTNLNVEN